MNNELEIIVAVGRDSAIGRNGDLIWHLPGDLKHFKALTTGHAVIMGRRTWESLPKRPLPGRLNIVVSRNPEYQCEGASLVSSLGEAITLADEQCERTFVIGGGEIYAQALPACTRLHLSLVDAVCEDADTRLPRIQREEWELVSDQPGMPSDPPYRWIELQRL